LLRSVASSRIWTRDLLIASPNALHVAPPRHQLRIRLEWFKQSMSVSYSHYTMAGISGSSWPTAVPGKALDRGVRYCNWPLQKLDHVFNSSARERKKQTRCHDRFKSNVTIPWLIKSDRYLKFLLQCRTFHFLFWATVYESVRSMLSDCCLSVLCPILSVTLVYCDQTVRWINMPLAMEVGLGPGHILLDGDPALP